MPLIGYMRISTSDQTHDLQRDALIDAGVHPDQIYEDTASGKQDDRPGLTACLKALRPGDTLVVWKLDRLGRSTKHLISTIEDLQKRDIEFKTISGVQIDTTGPMGKLIFTIFAGLAEFERALIVERTNAGLAAARARGRKGGRKPVMTKSMVHRAMAAMKDQKQSVADLASEFGMTPQAIYRYVAPDGSPRPTALKILGGKA